MANQNESQQHHKIGKDFSRHGDFLEAREAFEKSIALNPNNAYAYNNWGNALAAQKKYDEAIEQYQKAIDKDPNYVDAYFSWGIVLADQKKYEEAIKKYQEASQIEADNVVTVYASHNIADLLWRQGKYQESWEEWEEVRKAYKNKKQTAIKFHIAYFFQYFGQVVRETAGDPKKAEEIYKEGLALEPNHIGILTGLVDLYLEISDVDVNQRTTAYWRAREAYNKAVGILEDQITRTQDADSYRQLGELFLKMKEDEEAEKRFLDALEQYGESAELFADLGVLYTRKGRFKKACKYFEKAHRLDPDNLTIWSNLAEAYLKLNLKDKAEMEYKAILRITHGHIESHIGLGEVYTTMGDDGDGDMYDLAIHHFAEGIKLAKSMDKGSRRPKKGSKQLKTKELAAAYYSLGYARVMLYEASNTPKDESQLRQARENFVVCFKMDPDHHKAQRAKEKLEQRLNRFTPQGLIERVGPWVIAILSFLVFVVCQLGFFFNVPKSIGPDFYALLTFGSLIFMVAGLYMPHILKLRVGGIELEKSPVEQITISGSIGISK
jgi:tetratricopeptide (TPR) repeat protein